MSITEMSITDELREYAWQHMTNNQEIRAIADRIDAEHKMACDDAWDNGYETDYLGIEKWLTEHPQVMEHHGWIRLPKDANGEYIHIGDEMEYGKARGHVIALMLSNYPKKWGGGIHWGIQLEGEHAPTALDGLFRHYHASTVEDVLREMADRCYADEGEPRDRDAIVAEYAAKLRLAGDAE